MLFIYNTLALAMLLGTSLPCFLVFGLGLTKLLDRPNDVGLFTGVSVFVSSAILDLIIRLIQRQPKSIVDARMGAHVFFIPLWVLGPFVVVLIMIGAW